MLKAIHASEDLPTARCKAGEVVTKFRAQKRRKAAALVNEVVEETLISYAFPEMHWRRIGTNKRPG